MDSHKKELIKRSSVFILTMILILSLSSAVFAKTKEEAEARKAAKAKQAAVEKRRKRINAAKKKINETQWDVTVRLTSGEGSETKDTLRFSEGKIESDNLSREGFSATNFSVSLQGENTIIWETMQSSKTNGVAFWRGEIEGDVMRGILSRHLDEKTVKDYSFLSTSKGALEKREVIEDEPAVEEEEEIE